MKKVDRYKKNLLQGASSFLVVSFAVANGVAAVAATVTVPSASGTLLNTATTTEGADQANTDTAETIARVTATSTGVDATRELDAVVNSSVSVDTNSFGAVAVGNTAPSTLSRTGLASFSDQAALLTRQTNTDVPVSATTTGTTFAITVGDAAATGGLGTVTGSNVVIGANSDTASATGNTATQNLVLEATTLAVGNPTGFVTGDGLSVVVEAVTGAAAVTAQINDGSSVVASNSDSAIALTNLDDVGLSAGSSLTIEDNAQDASATGSESTNRVTLSGTTISGGSAAASVQENIATSVGAVLSNSDATLTIANTTNDAVAAIDGNTQQAVATGMTAANTLSADATTLTLETGSASLSTTSSATSNAFGSALVSSTQLSDAASPVTASNSSAGVTLSVSDASGTSTDSSFSVTGNTQQAAATAMNADNAITLSGTTVGSGVGAINAQQSNGTVGATTTGGAALNVAASVAGSEVDLSGNRLQAYANSATTTNSVDVTATTVSVVAADALNSSVAPAGAQVGAAYAALNEQTVSGDTSALVMPTTGTAAFTVDIAGSATAGSAISNDSNVMIARAQAASGTNSIDLNVGGTLSTTANGEVTFGNIASVTNSQLVATGTDVSATAASNGTATVYTEVTGALTNSSISTSGNRQQAFADGATASNSLTVSATTLDVAGGASVADGYTTGVASSDLGTLSTDAAFAVANSQSGAGTVTASLRDPAYAPLDPETGSTADPLVRTVIGGNVSGADVAANGNLLDAFATSNKATNTATISATSLSGTASVSNAQTSNAVVEATNYASIPGYDPVVAPDLASSTDNVTATTALGSSLSGSTLTVANGESFSIDLTSLTAAELVDATRYLEAEGFTVSNGIASTSGNGTYDLSVFGEVALATGTGAAAGELVVTGLAIDGFEGVPSAGGVVTTVGGNIVDSSVSVDGNYARGSAISNSATNSLSVATTTLTADGANVDAVATITDSDTVQAAADFTVLNAQELGAAASSTTFVKSAFGIEQADGLTIDNSNLSVSGNVQFAEALGNSAANSLNVSALDGGNGATAALASVQEGQGAEISASSNMELFADVVADGSSISLDGNRNTALASVNNITNSLSVSATNVGNGNGVAVIANNEMQADYVTASLQDASGTLSSVASTSAYNSDSALLDNGGTFGSTLSMSGNSTMAEASANRATNLMAVYGSADMGATAAMANRQSSTTEVTASASASYGISLYGEGSEEVASQLSAESAYAIDGNSTTALARGNYASNGMSYEAGATYSTGDSVVLSGNQTVASAALYNQQANYGGVSAEATNVTYGFALNNVGDASSTSALNSAASVANNTVNAFAFGNSASNTLTMAALNTGMPSAAVNSSQINQGAITASVSNVTFGAFGAGAGAGSAFNTSGNSVLAQAVGNSAVSVMGSR